MYKTNNLISQVNSLLKSYDKIAKATGENFNIFTVMGMETDEVKTHSRIIAELLNPKGTHGQGSVFLKLFFEEIEELRSIKDFDFENANVIVEEHIGIINKDYTCGGYIDIVIKDKRNKKEVVIENKIYATDQKGQLYRYKNAYPKSKLLYLTLDGKEPSKESYYHSDENKIDLMDIVLVSYVNNILSWIDKCHKEAIQQPMLREMLKQYSNLLKKLTHQTINNELKMELSELIKNNLAASYEISKNFETVYEKILNDLLNEIKFSLDISINTEDIKNESEMNWVIKIEKIKDKGDFIFINHKDWQDIQITFRFKKKVPTYNIRVPNYKILSEKINILKKDNNAALKYNGEGVFWIQKVETVFTDPNTFCETNKETIIENTINAIKIFVKTYKESIDKLENILT